MDPAIRIDYALMRVFMHSGRTYVMKTRFRWVHFENVFGNFIGRTSEARIDKGSSQHSGGLADTPVVDLSNPPVQDHLALTVTVEPVAQAHAALRIWCLLADVDELCVP